jgi:hypothetical protein
MGEAIELVEWRMNPFFNSSSICRRISGFKISGMRYSLSRFGTKLGDTLIVCSMYEQNPGVSLNIAEIHLIISEVHSVAIRSDVVIDLH